MSKYRFSNKPLDYVYAIIWVVVFIIFAGYIYSGEMFAPRNGRIHIIAILIAWIAEYLTLVGTAILFVVIGALIGLGIIYKKDSDDEDKIIKSDRL